MESGPESAIAPYSLQDTLLNKNTVSTFTKVIQMKTFCVKTEFVSRENRQVKVIKIAAMLDISNGSAHHIIDMLQFHEVYAR